MGERKFVQIVQVYAFVWEKGKTMDFSETILVNDIKVSRCCQLNDMNRYEYQRSRSFITLVQGHCYKME